MPEGAVYVGRPSKWGNPWPIDTLHDALIVGTFAYDWSGNSSQDLWGSFFGADIWPVQLRHAFAPAVERTAVELFRQLALHFRDYRPTEFAEWIAPLRGKDLACWCPLDQQPCHADVLLDLANRPEVGDG